MKIRSIEIKNTGSFFIAEDCNSLIIFENKKIPFNGYSEEYLSALLASDKKVADKDIYVDFLIGTDSQDLKIFKIADSNFNLIEYPLRCLPGKALELLETFYREGVSLNYPRFMQNLFNQKRSNMLASLSLMRQVV